MGLTVGIVWDFLDCSSNGRDVTGYSTWDWQAAPVPDGDDFTSQQHSPYNGNGSVAGWPYAGEGGPDFSHTQIDGDVNQVTGTAMALSRATPTRGPRVRIPVS